MRITLVLFSIQAGVKHVLLGLNFLEKIFLIITDQCIYMYIMVYVHVHVHACIHAVHVFVGSSLATKVFIGNLPAMERVGSS